MLEKHPVLKAAIANQYQLILAATATALAVATVSPLPWLLLLGGQFIAAPFLLERIKRRLEIEKKYASRNAEVMTQEQRFAEMRPEGKQRFAEIRKLTEHIERNYKALSPNAQDVLADQREKFDAMLATVLRRLWLLEKHDQMTRAFDEGRVRYDVKQIEKSLEEKGAEPRLREALGQNLEIKKRLLEAYDTNMANKAALLAELDSVESLLHLLLQKSLAATDAQAFSVEIDDMLQQAEADAAAVREMERLMGAMPELSQTLSEKLRQPIVGVNTNAAPTPRTQPRRERA